MIRLRCVLNALGKILLIVAFAMLVPLIWSAARLDGVTLSLLLTTLIYAVLGAGLIILTKERGHIRAKEGFLIVTLSWLVVSFIGALPYYFGGVFPDYVSCFFETMSGFTTTGGTALSDIEAVPDSLLIWRAMTQWLGGLGVVVLFVAILSQVDTGGLTMLRAELSGPFNEKISSKVQDSAIKLWLIYLVLSVTLILLLLAGGMSLTDAVCHGFSAISTGGFSSYNESVAAFHSAYVEWVVTIFMFIGGVSFPLIYKTVSSRSPKTLFRNEEFRVYLFFTLFIAAVIFVDLMIHRSGDAGVTLRTALFQTVSQLTTCGLSATDYELWPSTSYMIMFCLMMIGASYSSTSGSLKIGTYVLAYRSLKSQFFRMLHPRALTEIRINGRPIHEKTVMKVLQFASLFFILAFIGSVLLSMCGMPFKEALTGAMAAISNNGVAMGALGPSGNYAFVPSSGKIILSMLMLLGRMEIYTVLIVFVPAFWKK
ncbi:MAG: TrkH family potassium uptake protein [Bacillota bacterium]|jgi:trk system potassium uptake protein TrkH